MQILWLSKPTNQYKGGRRSAAEDDSTNSERWVTERRLTTLAPWRRRLGTTAECVAATRKTVVRPKPVLCARHLGLGEDVRSDLP